MFFSSHSLSVSLSRSLYMWLFVTQMHGSPFLTLLFFMYLSVRIPSFWAPRKNFHCGKNRIATSSSTMYSTDSSQSLSENSPQKYMCRPKDLAHSVFPSLVAPTRMRDLGRSVLERIKPIGMRGYIHSLGKGGDWGPPGRFYLFVVGPRSLGTTCRVPAEC